VPPFHLQEIYLRPDLVTPMLGSGISIPKPRRMFSLAIKDGFYVWSGKQWNGNWQVEDMTVRSVAEIFLCSKKMTNFGCRLDYGIQKQGNLLAKL